MSSSILTPASAMTASQHLTAAMPARDAVPARHEDVDPPAQAAYQRNPLSGTAQSYVASLSDAIASGVGPLIHADMNVAAARLRALQMQKRLGNQPVSIANQHNQLVLKLFGG